MTLAKPKSHWRNPRKAIANNLRHHDIAYATHGALQAMQVLLHYRQPGSTVPSIGINKKAPGAIRGLLVYEPATCRGNPAGCSTTPNSRGCYSRSTSARNDG